MKTIIASLLTASIFISCTTAAESKEHQSVFRGIASFYADAFHGRRTASGARLNQHSFTCAHRTLPFGTKVLVENPDTGEKCVVTVTDRGPFHSKRIIDLTKAAARKIGITGLGKVVCKTLGGSGHAKQIAESRGSSTANTDNP